MKVFVWLSGGRWSRAPRFTALPDYYGRPQAFVHLVMCSPTKIRTAAVDLISSIDDAKPSVQNLGKIPRTKKHAHRAITAPKRTETVGTPTDPSPGCWLGHPMGMRRRKTQIHLRSRMGRLNSTR